MLFCWWCCCLVGDAAVLLVMLLSFWCCCCLFDDAVVLLMMLLVSHMTQVVQKSLDIQCFNRRAVSGHLCSTCINCVEWYSKWIMNCKGYGRERLWLNGAKHIPALARRTVEKHEICLSGQPMSWSSLEPDVSRIQVRSVTAWCSVPDRLFC
jgi:hypothetical protein